MGAMAEGRDRYFQSDSKKLVPKALKVVPYKGAVSETIYQILGGLRSGMGYCGTASIKELKENGNLSRLQMPVLKKVTPRHLYHKGSAQPFHHPMIEQLKPCFSCSDGWGDRQHTGKLLTDLAQGLVYRNGKQRDYYEIKRQAACLR